MPGGLTPRFRDRARRRVGAAHALDAIRRALRRYHNTYNLGHDSSLNSLRLVGAGNLNLRQPDHGCNYAHIRERPGELLRQHPRVVLLGGPHDGIYSMVRGLFDANDGQTVEGINFDAHADMKEKPAISSGMPFGKLLRDGFLPGSNFTEIGLHFNRNTKPILTSCTSGRFNTVPLTHVQKDGMKLYFSRV